MAESILDKLKIKPKPKIKEDVSISLKLEKPKDIQKDQPININIPIIDKRKEIKLDRKDLLEKLKGNIGIEAKIPQVKDVETKKTEKTDEKEEKEDEPVIFIKPIKKKKLNLTTVSTNEKDDTGEKSEKGKTEKGKTEKGKTEKRTTVKPTEAIISGPESMLNYSELEERLPKKEPKILVKAPAYYMNNREIFINFVTSLFTPYSKEIEEMEKNYSCNKSSSGFDLLIHQKMVRDYLNLYTPYRGLLLYHGLGSGKTCSSIAIAEGFKSDKLIYVMIPASLRVNYREELKKCGDQLYRKNQYWEFIDIKTNPELLEPLSHSLNLTVKFIKDNGGAWFVNVKKKEANYDKLTTTKQVSLDKQLNEMIDSKYKFINYNGIRMSHLNILTENNTKNPFSNTVIIIDEAHNFVSRIVNKIEREKKADAPQSLPTKLYNLLMTAENCKIVLLTGTPIINYPNEIGILMNILRGKIKTWRLRLSINEERKLSEETLREIFNKNKKSKDILDFIEYKTTSNTLIITRNPYGFSQYIKDESNYNGISLNDDGNISDSEFIKVITSILEDNNISIIPNSLEIKTYNCLPDSLENFSSYFIQANEKRKDELKVKNMNLFKRRILGLTSYFPDIDALLPKYSKLTNYHIKYIELSEFQFAIYEEARVQERKIELNNAKKKKQKGNSDVYDDAVSTYRIFSRAFCNFVFPKPHIVRPMPKDGRELSAIVNESEDIRPDMNEISEITQTDKELLNEELEELQEIASEFSDDSEESSLTYELRIRKALTDLEENKDKFLTPEALEVYSPKFLNLLENVIDPSYIGLHLMYSQFRTLEGIGIFSLVLKANGFAEFKIKKDGEWKLDIPIEERGKPNFVLYTGTETAEEKEIIRNIFNGDWGVIPASLRIELEKISSNNLFGEIIKIIMITSSGAEGISLKNVRYVHLTEPYWHPIRLEQVIGRARRICSHKDLPVELQTVDVFLYLMKFSDDQIKNNKSIHLDRSKIDNKTPLTSDQALYEISQIKENVNKEILKNVKEASIDCNIHNKVGNKAGIECFSFGTVKSDKYSNVPSISDEESDKITSINTKEVVFKNVKKITIPGIGDVALNKDTNDVYTLESYKSKKPVQIGKITLKKNETTGKTDFKFTRI